MPKRPGFLGVQAFVPIREGQLQPGGSSSRNNPNSAEAQNPQAGDSLTKPKHYACAKGGTRKGVLLSDLGEILLR